MGDYTSTGANANRTREVGFQGSEAGKSFASSADVEEGKDWDAYKKEKNLMFTASRVQHKDPYAAWRRERAKKKGQMKVVGSGDSASTGSAGGTK